MIAEIHTITLAGIHAQTIQIQVQIAPGIASFNIVGLPDSAVKESRDRIRGAFHALGIALPAKRITVSLSPADIHKEGNHFDLPIAIGLLKVLKIVPHDHIPQSLFLGELGLDGSIRGIVGALPAAIHAKTKQFENLFLPQANGNEASWVEGVAVYPCNHLKELMHHLQNKIRLTTAQTPEVSTPKSPENQLDFSDVRGQEFAKRAAEIAAAGGHNMLMCGTPGSGKSMIAKRMVGIMPSLSSQEILDISMIHSIAGLLPDHGIVHQKPFREPHHTASAVALCGGGLKANPGEMSLAHGGVLFLDELPEFPRQVLETLRQPLETGEITVSRANHHVTYPANFQFIAAMNPSPCGYLGHPSIPCTSTPKQIQNYRNKLSGPLLDRIDLHVDVAPVSIEDMQLPPAKETSATIKKRVDQAYALQEQRYKQASISKNSQLYGALLDQFCPLSADCIALMQKASEKYAMSARGYHRILRVARTIADLAGEQNIAKPHISEALMYRYIPYKPL